MSRHPARFTQADITRAVKAVTGLGMKVGEVNITRDGNIRIIPLAAETVTGDDDVLSKFRAERGYS